jgi:hypothetical protein
LAPKAAYVVVASDGKSGVNYQEITTDRHGGAAGLVEWSTHFKGSVYVEVWLMSPDGVDHTVVLANSL